MNLIQASMAAGLAMNSRMHSSSVPSSSRTFRQFLTRPGYHACNRGTPPKPSRSARFTRDQIYHQWDPGNRCCGQVLAFVRP